VRWLQAEVPITEALRASGTRPQSGEIRTAALQAYPGAGSQIVVSALTGGWAQLDSTEWDVLQRLDGSDAQDASVLIDLDALWWRGLISIDGGQYIERSQHDALVASTRSHYSLVLLLNSGCNLACTYCYLGHAMPSPSHAMSTELINAAIDQAFDQPFAEVLIDFGEIAVARGAFECAVHYAEQVAAERGKVAHLSIQTNGTTLDDELADFIAEHHVSVGLSIDGDAATHDSARVFRNGQGSHDRSLAGLQRCVARRVPVHVPVTIGRHNVADPLGVLAQVRQLGAGSWLFKPILAQGEAALAWDAEGVTAEAYAEFMRVVIEAANDDSLDLLDTTARKFLWRLASDGRGWGDSCTSRNCGSGDSLHVVDPKGGVHACPRYVETPRSELSSSAGGRATLPLVDVLPPGLRAAPTSCAGCSWLHSCGGGCTLSGGPDAIPMPDPHCVAYDEIHQTLIRRVLPRILDGSHSDCRLLERTVIVDQPLHAGV
jgi:radical SAM protein with 4Fe4S-binding SPASM domain